MTTCCRTCHTMQVVSLEPEIKWMPQWSTDKQDTMSETRAARSECLHSRQQFTENNM